MVTVAPATNPPEESETVPVISALGVCACKTEMNKRTEKTAHKADRMKKPPEQRLGGMLSETCSHVTLSWDRVSRNRSVTVAALYVLPPPIKIRRGSIRAASVY